MSGVSVVYKVTTVLLEASMTVTVNMPLTVVTVEDPALLTVGFPHPHLVPALGHLVAVKFLIKEVSSPWSPGYCKVSAGTKTTDGHLDAVKFLIKEVSSPWPPGCCKVSTGTKTTLGHWDAVKFLIEEVLLDSSMINRLLPSSWLDKYDIKTTAMRVLGTPTSQLYRVKDCDSRTPLH
jgi:hypothetical protein